MEEAHHEFAAVRAAYEVLSDPQERAWYDRHRTAILSRDRRRAAADADDAPSLDDLLKYFNETVYDGYGDDPRGFFAIYRDLFQFLEEFEADDELAMASQRGRAPSTSAANRPAYTSFGSRASPYEPMVRQFYDKWLHFVSNRTFDEADRYQPTWGENRRLRRAMHKENAKERERLRREFSETVRELAAFVRRRDPRYAEYQRQRSERRAQEEAERRARERVRREEAAENYVEPDWSRLDEEQLERIYLREHDHLDHAEEETDDGPGAETESLGTPIDSDDQTDYDAEEEPAKADNDTESKGPSRRGDRSTPVSTTMDIKSLNGRSSSNQVEPMGESELAYYTEFYCAACKKLFKNHGQWTNHARSKKHRSKLQSMGIFEDEDEAEAEAENMDEHEHEHEHEDRDRHQGGKGIPRPHGDDTTTDGESSVVDPFAGHDRWSGRATTRTVEDLANDLQDLHMGVTDGNSDANDNSNNNDSNDSDGDGDGAAAIPSEAKMSARGRRRRAKDKASQPSQPFGSPSHTCVMCRTSFETRNALFRHLEESGHAVPPTKGRKSKPP